MDGWFLIPLVIGLAGGFVSLCLAEEISGILGVFTVISLLISLFLAPWEFQVGILLLVLLGVRQVWRRLTINSMIPSAVLNPHEAKVFPKKTKTEDKQAQETKCYRGITYSSDNHKVIAITDNKVVKYRGVSLEVHELRATPLDAIKSKLKYRGISVETENHSHDQET